MLLHEKKLIFIHIPKCAGTSIEIFFTGRDWAEIDDTTKHISAREARQKYGREVWAEYFKFSVVRNPWSRFVSFYNLLRLAEPGTEFDPWIRQVCSPEGLRFRGMPVSLPMTGYIGDTEGNLMVDFVAKVESLETDFSFVLDRLGLPARKLPRAMVGHYDHDYRSWYTPETQERVAERFREDIERFDYHF